MISCRPWRSSQASPRIMASTTGGSMAILASARRPPALYPYLPVALTLAVSGRDRVTADRPGCPQERRGPGPLNGVVGQCVAQDHCAPPRRVNEDTKGSDRAAEAAVSAQS